MSTIVEASVPAAQFALQETARRVPEATFAAVRVVTGGGESVMPLLWSSGTDRDAITAALEADGSTDAVRVLTQRRDACLYRLEWTTRVRVVTHVLGADHGAILSAQERGGTWTFRVLFPERNAVGNIVEKCDQYDIDLRVKRIHPMTHSSRAGRAGLTDEQFHTIEAALEGGYYDVPRKTTLTQLSAELGVSHQALSERLRRGHRQLVKQAIERSIQLESEP